MIFRHISFLLRAALLLLAMDWRAIATAALAILAGAVLLSGCAGLASPGASLGCQASDVATTAVALHNGAHEANPIMGGVLKSLGWPGFVLVKLGVGLWLAHEAEQHRTVVASVNAATCATAAHNLMVH